MLELTEIPVSGEKDFCFTFRVPILPDWTEERRNYYTRVEIWKPARRSQSSCTISPRNCIFQLSKHTNISISRAKEASDPAASEAVPRLLRNPSIFLAYAREPGHVEWVNEQLAMMLERQGFVVWIDDRMLISGKIEQQVKNGILKADIIVPVVTAKYRERWSQGLGGVGQEKPIILRARIGRLYDHPGSAAGQVWDSGKNHRACGSSLCHDGPADLARTSVW